MYQAITAKGDGCQLALLPTNGKRKWKLQQGNGDNSLKD